MYARPLACGAGGVYGGGGCRIISRLLTKCSCYKNQSMIDFPDAEKLQSFASMLAPGLFISTIRARVINGNFPNLKDNITAYLIISIGYFACISPFFNVDEGLTIPIWLADLLKYVVIPITIGVIYALFYQWQTFYKAAKFLGLHFVHHRPAAWDYAFESLNACYILVTLNDGSRVAGLWQPGSFASSTKDERDLFLTEIFKLVGKKDDWTRLNPPRGILICGKDIRYVEFIGNSS